MLDEITAAALFLVQLIEKNEKFSQNQVELFGRRLVELLTERFENHWFPDKPFKGQGYRCIRVNANSRRDSTLESAAYAAGVKYEDLSLPVELTLWVDPNEVCCRFGESKGSYCTLASFDKPKNNSDNENKENSPANGGSKPLQKNPAASTSASNSETKPPLTSTGQNSQQQQQQQQQQHLNNGSSSTGRRRNSNSPRSHPNRNRSWFNHSFGMSFGGGGGGGASGSGGGGGHPMSQAWYGVMPPHFFGAPSPPPFIGHRGTKWMHPSSYPGTGFTTRFQHHWSTSRATLKV